MIDYYLLTKPGIIFGNIVTFAAGFLLASKGEFHLGFFFTTLVGLTFIIASACVFNNYIDRHVDQKMERTKHRALAKGTINGRNALCFAIILAIAGNLILLYYTNHLTVTVTNVGFTVYVCLYSFLKCRTTYSTLIGSIAGAIPPLVGYCAVSNRFDLAAAILFLIMIFWQMPHFYAIALWRFDDYSRAGIPVLPISRGVLRTKIHMVLYLLLLIPTLSLLTLFDYTGNLFSLLSIPVCLAWLYYGIKGFFTDCDKSWGRHMFRLSLLMIGTICFLISLNP